MFSDQPTPALPVARHLFPERTQIPARLIDDREFRAIEGTKPGLEDAIIEFYVFASVESLIEKANCIEDLPAIHGAGTRRIYGTFLVRLVNGRVSSMTERCSPGVRHYVLKNRIVRGRQRLWPAEAIGPGPLKQASGVS